jgi:hypothetical protein
LSFLSLLTHTVHIERDDDAETEDDYGTGETTVSVGEDFKADIQPRSAREIAASSQAGAPLSEYTIFMLPRVLSPGNRIIHDTAGCGLPDSRDFGDIVFEIDGIRNATGRGHHLEVDVRAVGIGLSASVEGS